MGRYSRIEWAGKAVRQSTAFILAVTEQAWNYSAMNEWRPTAGCIEALGVKPLVAAYNAVAEHHNLPAYVGRTDVKGLLASKVGSDDIRMVQDDGEFIAVVFNNSMQFMANNPGWQAAQEGMEKVAMERLENLIRFVRRVSRLEFEAEQAELTAKVSA